MLSVEVFQRIKPSFTTSVSSACVNEPVILSNTTPQATSIQWIIPETKIDTNQSLIKAFSSPGIYAIWLISTTEHGCTDSVKQEVTVYDVPGYEWQIGSSKQGVYHFKAMDSVQTFYQWNFGNGDSATGANVNYTYTSDGKYFVTLKIKNSHGCETLKDTMMVVKAAVSVAENNLVSSEINIYPNPFNDQLSISWASGDHQPYSVFMYDSQGRLVHEVTTATYSKEPVFINTSAMPAGIYCIVLKSKTCFGVKKVIRSR